MKKIGILLLILAATMFVACATPNNEPISSNSDSSSVSQSVNEEGTSEKESSGEKGNSSGGGVWTPPVKQ